MEKPSAPADAEPGIIEKPETPTLTNGNLGSDTGEAKEPIGNGHFKAPVFNLQSKTKF